MEDHVHDAVGLDSSLVLARRYSGTWSEARYAAEAAALDVVRAREGLRAIGDPSSAG